MIRRSDFPILKKKINGHSMVYFDNAATTQKPRQVVEAMSDFYFKTNANVHRGINPLAEEATSLYEQARHAVAKFIGATPEETIFTRGTTEGVNLVARTWGETNLRSSDRVVLSLAEHHADIVPWLQLQAKVGFKLDFIPISDNGAMDLLVAKKLLNRPRVKFLGVTQTSNVLGVINNLKPLLALARSQKIVTLVDAAQSIAHLPIDVKKLGCDFLAFSGHKIYGPTGIGVLYGRRELLEKMPPFLGGGEMIKSVHTNGFTTNDLPHKFEAGTPPIAEAIGLRVALGYLKKIGWAEITTQERKLTKYFLKKIKPLSFVKILGSSRATLNRLPVFSLVIDDIHAHDAADLLGQEGIILRAGNHCAQPIQDYCKVEASLRASLTFYNTVKEIDIFISRLKHLHRIWTMSLNKQN